MVVKTLSGLVYSRYLNLVLGHIWVYTTNAMWFFILWTMKPSTTTLVSFWRSYLSWCSACCHHWQQSRKEQRRGSGRSLQHPTDSPSSSSAPLQSVPSSPVQTACAGPLSGRKRHKEDARWVTGNISDISNETKPLGRPKWSNIRGEVSEKKLTNKWTSRWRGSREVKKQPPYDAEWKQGMWFRHHCSLRQTWLENNDRFFKIICANNTRRLHKTAMNHYIKAIDKVDWH